MSIWMAFYILGASGTLWFGVLAFPENKKHGARAMITFPVWPVWAIVLMVWLARKAVKGIIRLFELAEWKKTND